MNIKKVRNFIKSGVFKIKTFICDNTDKKQNCLILLPGRFGSALHIMHLYESAVLEETTLVGIEPENEWYPLPNGVGDQQDSILGMKKTRKILSKTIHKIQKHLGFTSRQVALVGFSAGGVMAIQCAIHTQERFAGVVVHSGAILQPRKIPPTRFADLPFLLIHNRQDECFSWDERYIPMKKALLKRGYLVQTIERDSPEYSHNLSNEDIISATSFINRLWN